MVNRWQAYNSESTDITRYLFLLCRCVFSGAGSISPVNDLCGMEWFNCSKAERQGRCKLACLYRLLDLYGHTHFPNTYITVSTPTHFFLPSAHTNCFSNLIGLTVLLVILKIGSFYKIGSFCSDNIGCHSDSEGLSVITMQREKRIAAIVEKIDKKLFILPLFYHDMSP